MPDYVLPPAPVPAIPVRGSAALFPVRRIYCIGRNYAAHTVEMGGDPDREAPFFFQKNPDAADASGIFPWPEPSREVHHEIELAVALGAGGRDIAVGDAMACVWGYGVALDMTCRDLQAEAKAQSRPWEVAKAAERSAPISALVPAAEVARPDRGAITLRVNGVLRQEGDLGQMIWKTPEIIAVLSRHFLLAPGDLILTGTPSGVGPVARGDLLEASVAGIGDLRVKVV